MYGRSKGNLEEPQEIINPQYVQNIEDSLKNYETYSSSFRSDYLGNITYKQYNTKRSKKQ
jgi:hypothetical protein